MRDDEDLFGWRRRMTRRDDDATSHQAADDIHAELNVLWDQTLTMAREGGHHGWINEAFEKACTNRYGKRGDGTYRRRLTDLERMKLVEDAGETRLNTGGKSQKVRRAVSMDRLPSLETVKGAIAEIREENKKKKKKKEGEI